MQEFLAIVPPLLFYLLTWPFRSLIWLYYCWAERISYKWQAAWRFSLAISSVAGLVVGIVLTNWWVLGLATVIYSIGFICHNYLVETVKSHDDESGGTRTLRM